MRLWGPSQRRMVVTWPSYLRLGFPGPPSNGVLTTPVLTRTPGRISIRTIWQSMEFLSWAAARTSTPVLPASRAYELAPCVRPTSIPRSVERKENDPNGDPKSGGEKEEDRVKRQKRRKGRHKSVRRYDRFGEEDRGRPRDTRHRRRD